MNWKVLAVGGAIVVPLVAFLAAGFGTDPRALPDAMSGKDAPTFVLETLDGETVDLAQAAGSPVVLNFWATWCVPCAQEHATLVAAAKAYESRGVVFLGVLYADDPDKARAYLKRKGASYPTLIDPAQRVSINYGVAGVPETFFISRDGQLIHKQVGPVDRPTIDHYLQELL